jgi:hypothetical protein
MDSENGMQGVIPVPIMEMESARARRSINNVVKMLRDIGTEEII